MKSSVLVKDSSGNFKSCVKGAPVGVSYEVVIRADVQDSRIVDTLTALRVLHQKMGNKRVMIVYAPTDPNALPATLGLLAQPCL